MTFFKEAKAVWAEGREQELNLSLAFSACIPKASRVILRITASCLYRASFNGNFLGYGPARAAHGYFRVDEYVLPENTEGELLIEVAGYNTQTFYTLDQPSFLLAEVTDGEEVLLATGRDGDFICRETDRLQKVAKFSYQRAFGEIYIKDGCAKEIQTQTVVPCGKLLPRGVKYADFSNVEALPVEYGVCEMVENEQPVLFPNLLESKQKMVAFYELQEFPESKLCKLQYKVGKRMDTLVQNTYCTYRFPCVETGFLGIKIEIPAYAEVYLLFDEINFREECKADEPINVDYLRNTCYNVIGYKLSKGSYDLMSFEAYSAGFVKVVVLEGEATLQNVYIKRFQNAFLANYTYKTGDNELDEIIVAAARTFAHNAVDLLTDCPSRERAGWLCDSWFSARSERFFTGENLVERNFLENYALAPQLAILPEGMIAMCYPADLDKELFIPNWSMWYMLELKDYFDRTGDKVLIEKSREKVEGLLRYFAKFENELGVLEDLENWVFIEWSKANDPDFIKGVNWPSNMLYAAALEAVGEMCGLSHLICKAKDIRETICKHGFQGEFMDNSVRKDGKLIVTDNVSETCQYYAFFFGVADGASHPALLKKLLTKFGPNRNVENVYPNVHRSNAFIGNYMRLEIMARLGFKAQVLQECKAYFGNMAKRTGTLWEHDSTCASLDHGFASYIAPLIERCL